ncbi:MAG: hypothetical protein RLN76_03400 [Phycisphaeraceae bacterium]
MTRVYALAILLLMPLSLAAQDLEISVDDLNQQIEQSREQVTSDQTEPEDRVAIARARIEAMRQLVLDFPEAEAFPTHLAEWAEAELYERLGALESLAILAHEFGVASPTQTAAMRDALPLVINQIEAFDLDSDRVDDPLRWRLLLSLATAHHASALIADSPEPHLAAALAALDRITEEIGRRPIPPAVSLLRARILLASGEVDAARGLAQPLLETEPLPIDGTTRTAQLLVAETFRLLDDPAAGEATIARLNRTLSSPADAPWRLLLADWMARERDDLEIYRPLTLAGPGVEWVRATLANRWLEQFADTPPGQLTDLPLWIKTQLVQSAWERLPVHPVEALAFAPTAMLSPEQLDRLGWVRGLAQQLADRTDLLADARRESARTAILADFAASPRQPLDAVEAAGQLLELVRYTRKDPRSITLTREAADLLWPHDAAFLGQDEDPVSPLLDAALDSVLSQNPLLLADTPNHVLMAASHLDQPGVPAARAIAFYRAVPLDAAGYWQAQPLLLLALHRGSVETIDPPVRRRYRQELQLEMARMEAEASRLLTNESATVAQRDGARTALFRVRVLRGRLAADNNDFAAARDWLEEALTIDSRPGARLEVDVMATRFLVDQGRIAEGLERLEQLPANQTVVRRLAIDMMSAITVRLTPIDLLELDPPDDTIPPPAPDAAALALAEASTSRSLRTIDPEDPNPAAQAERYAASLLRARALLLRGDAVAAAGLAGVLIESDFATPEVIELALVAQLRTGDPAGLGEAALLADRIIQGYSDPPYPDRWWRCWLRRLLILERMGVATAQIPPQVRRLERTNPNLGGAELRPRFLALAERAAKLQP